MILEKSVSDDLVYLFKEFCRWIQDNDMLLNIILKDSSLFNGRDAIQRSIYHHSPKVFNFLMSLVDQNLLDFEFCSARGKTALHATALNRTHLEFIPALIKRGCSPFARGLDGVNTFQQMISFHNFAAADCVLDCISPADRQRLFTEPKPNGSTLLGSLVTAAVTNYRHSSSVQIFLYLDRIGAAEDMTGNVSEATSVLDTLAAIWPSTRLEYLDFDSWLLGWVLDHCSAETANKGDAEGLTPVMWMIAHANDRAVAKMLQNAMVDPHVLSAPGPGAKFGIPAGLSALDIALQRCMRIPEHHRRGGVREVLLFAKRAEAVVKMLLEAGVEPIEFARVPRENLLDLARLHLEENVANILTFSVSSARSTGGDQSGDGPEGGEFSALDDISEDQRSVSWPQTIPAPHKKQQDGTIEQSLKMQVVRNDMPRELDETLIRVMITLEDQAADDPEVPSLESRLIEIMLDDLGQKDLREPASKREVSRVKT
jgi:hypothetical protein